MKAIPDADQSATGPGGASLPTVARPATEAAPLQGGEMACSECLRRGELLGRLAPRIAELLQQPRPRPVGLLELSDADLIAAVAGGRDDEVWRWLHAFEAERARRAVAAARLECVCRHSAHYPPALAELPDPPATLYVAGGAARLGFVASEPAVTVVGSRHASPYALEVATALGRGLAAAGVTVVSGLALGVDGAAHRGALAAGDRVLAVLAGGADVPYPRSHTSLYERVRSLGVVVSELPPGVRPMRWGFPARNRIMAALGGLTLVVEAGDPSGALITATFAESIGRGVCAVPGRVTSAKAAGSNRLLREGAGVIRGAEDALDELFGIGVGVEGGDARRRELAAAAVAGPSVASLEPAMRRVLEAVEAGHRLDAIGRTAGLPAGEVRGALGRLELLGLVSRDGLGLYERTAGR